MNVFRRFWNWLHPPKQIALRPLESQVKGPLPKPKLGLNREKYRAIAERNRERQRATLGYGLKSRDFKPRPAHEKRLFDVRKKAEETD